MLKLPTLRRRVLLLALCPALLLAGCGPEAVNSTPEPARFAPAPRPTVPAGEAACDDNRNGVREPCLSDTQTGHLIDGLIDTIEADENKLMWLLNYFYGGK